MTARIWFIIVPAVRAVLASPNPTELLGAFASFLIPANGLFQPRPENTSAQSGVLRFVQMNKTIGFFSVFVAVLWETALRQNAAVARDKRDGKSIGNKSPDTLLQVARAVIFRSLPLSILFGPGFALATTLVGREMAISGAFRTGR